MSRYHSDYMMRYFIALQVFIMDPCLNVALEDQAVGRVHRMGQTREVHVYRLAMKGSVDERVLDVGKQRRSLAGNMSQDKATLNILEFDQLFKDIKPPEGVNLDGDDAALGGGAAAGYVESGRSRKRSRASASSSSSSSRKAARRVQLMEMLQHLYQGGGGEDDDDFDEEGDY